MWMVRAGEKCFLYDQFKKEQKVAMGWDLGDLSEIDNQEDLDKIIEKRYPNKSVSITKGNRRAFLLEMEKSDKIVTYNIKTRKYLIGEIISDYIYDPDFVRDSKDYNDIRKVEWFGEVNKDKLTKETLKKLGASQTVFKVNQNAEKELLVLLNKEII